ncbi:hypothetical protein PVBG_01681, partial [Plasmodium vivax Brazil I]
FYFIFHFTLFLLFIKSQTHFFSPVCHITYDPTVQEHTKIEKWKNTVFIRLTKEKAFSPHFAFRNLLTFTFSQKAFWRHSCTEVKIPSHTQEPLSPRSKSQGKMKKGKSKTKKKLPKGQERYIPTQEEVEKRNAEITRKQQKEEPEKTSEMGSLGGGSMCVTDSQVHSSENEKKTPKKKVRIVVDEKVKEKEAKKEKEEKKPKKEKEEPPSRVFLEGISPK